MDSGVKIITEDLGFTYHGLSLFGGVNLVLPDHNIVAITGPSGAGKSTFLSIFNRLWQEEGCGRCQGTVRIRFDGWMVDIYRDGMDIADLRRRVGMVFQSPNPLPMSIYKNVAFPLRLAGFVDNGQIAERVERMLKKVHLFEEVKDRLSMDGRKLSGGQQQRLCIARALMLEPEVLLLDEPTSSLDPKSCESIENLLLELKTTCTLLVVSHYQDQVRRVADQVYDLTAGQLRRVL
jgi:phosphate transport system ATP-binding protein